MNTQERHFVAAAVVIAAALSANGAASAGIISSTGAAVVYAAPPLSVEKDHWTSNDQIRIFQEQFGIVLDRATRVDTATPGVYDSRRDLRPEYLAEGALVNTYLVHEDPWQFNGGLRLRGSITFEEEILGVMISRSKLYASDPLFGAAGTAYPPADRLCMRGLELSRFQDRFRISADRHTIVFNFVTWESIDQMRIFTAPVPTPGSMALLLAAGLSAVGRRRRTA